MSDIDRDVSQPSDRLRSVALWLNIPLGVFGAHRFYVGKIGTGILQLCTLGGCGLWWLYDLILIASGEFKDENGQRLIKWSRDEMDPPRPQLPSAQVSEDMELMQTEIHELQERVDFLERMLTKTKDRGTLPKGD